MGATAISIVVTVISFLVNGTLLASVVQVVCMMLGVDVNPLLITMEILIAMVGLGTTPLVESVLRLAYGFRGPLREDCDKLYELFEKTCTSAGKLPSNYRLYVVDESNAFALGKNSIAVGRPLLKNCTNEEIMGVMGHELGHLHYGDTQRGQIFFILQLIGQSVIMTYWFLGSFFGVLARLPIPGANFCIGLISWILRVQFWLINFFVMLPLHIGEMLGSRQCEYRADQYAAQIGHGKGLYDYLYRLLDAEPSKNNGFLSLLYVSHPKTGDRLQRLENTF